MPATEACGSPLGGAYDLVLAPPGSACRYAHVGSCSVLGLPGPQADVCGRPGNVFQFTPLSHHEMISSCLLYVPPEPSIVLGQRCSISID